MDRVSAKIVVARLLSEDPCDARDPLPRRFQTLLDEGEIPGLGDVLRRSEQDLLAHPGIGSVEELKEWVARRTRALGRCLSWLQVRGLLQGDGRQAPPEERLADPLQVVDQLLASDPADPHDPIPARLLNRIRSGEFDGLGGILRGSEQDLLACRGIGTGSVAELDRWVAGRTDALGQRLTWGQVRAVLHAQASGRGTPAGHGGESVPAILRRVVERLLASDPADRRSPIPSPFRTRIRSKEFDGLGDILRRTKHDLMAHGALGVRSIEKMERWVATRTSKLGRTLSWSQVRTILREIDKNAAGENRGSSVLEGSVAEIARRLPEFARDLHVSLIDGLTERVRSALSRKGIQRIRDLDRCDLLEISSWRNFGPCSLEELRSALLRLEAGFAQSLQSPHGEAIDPIHAFVTRQPLMERVREVLLSQNERVQLVIARRTLTEGAGLTLVEVGTILGVTRERVRQLESGFFQDLDRSGWLAQVADERLGALRENRLVPLTLGEVEDQDPWFEGAASSPRVLARLLQGLGCDHVVVDDANEPPTDEPFVTLGSALEYTNLRWRLREGGAFRSRKDLIESAREMLRQAGVPEVLPWLLGSVDGQVVRIGRKAPSLVRMVETILANAHGPMSVNDIHDSLLPAGFSGGRDVLYAYLRKARMVRVGLAIYAHPANLESFWRHLAPLKTRIVALLGHGASRQWSSQEILESLQGEDPSSARITIYALEHLLAEIPAVRRLERSLWCLAEAHPEGRILINDLALRILQEHGQPMRCQDLLARVRERRSAGANVVFRWPLVRLARGLIGLAERDLGLGGDSWSRFELVVRTALERGDGRLAAEDLERLFAETSPAAEPIGAHRLVDLLVSRKVSRDGTGDGVRRTDVPRRGPGRRGRGSSADPT